MHPKTLQASREETVVARGLPLPGAYSLEGTRSVRRWRYFHEAYCVTLITAGSARWRYRGRDADLVPDCLMLVEPGELHVTTAVNVPVDFCALFFPIPLVRDILEAQNPRFRHTGTSCPELLTAFRTACRVLRSGPDEETARQMLSLAFAQAFEHTRENGARVPVSSARGKKAVRLLREAYENAPWKTVNVEQISSELGVSYHWFVHSFTREFGIPPYQYVQAVRLAKLRSLLAQGPSEGLRSLTDIAAALGFSDKSHLHRSVQREYGVSPWRLAHAINASWHSAPPPDLTACGRGRGDFAC